MGRKKKVPTKEPEEKKEEPVQAAPDLIAPSPQNGQAKVPDPPELLALIKARAVDVAKECGLKEPFLLSGPDRVDYPQKGHGYVVTVKEQTGKQRMGSARFNSEGEHRFWSQDTLITG